MTDIKSAIDHLDNLIGMIEDNQGIDYDADFKLAIRSLNAWSEVLQELEEEREEILNSNDYESEIVNYCLYNFDKAINIINQHLADVPDNNVGEIEK